MRAFDSAAKIERALSSLLKDVLKLAGTEGRVTLTLDFQRGTVAVARTERPEAVLPDRERDFLGRLRRTMEAHLADPRFNVDELAAEVFLSRRHLLRKVHGLTGEAPGDLLRRLRLERAAEHLRQGASVKETATAVGFRSPSHFARAFRDAFGVPPGSWAARPR
jgi:AraC-like DNA-binding protein